MALVFGYRHTEPWAMLHLGLCETVCVLMSFLAILDVLKKIKNGVQDQPDLIISGLLDGTLRGTLCESMPVQACVGSALCLCSRPHVWVIACALEKEGGSLNGCVLLACFFSLLTHSSLCDLYKDTGQCCARNTCPVRPVVSSRSVSYYSQCCPSVNVLIKCIELSFS